MLPGLDLSEDGDRLTPSLKRTLAILQAVSDTGTPGRPGDVAAQLGIPRSSAYQIIRTLIDGGHLEKASRGRVRLGPRFVDLLIAYQQQRQPKRATLARTANPTAQAPRSFLWNPQLTEMVNCSAFCRRPPYRIGFANTSTSNPWRVAMLHGMEHFAAQHADEIERFVVSDARDDAEKQAADIECMLREGLDLLLVSCNQAECSDAAIALAKEAGVPVVAVDRRPANDELFLTHVTASDIALGRITAQWIVERLNGEGAIFLLAGAEGSSPAAQRMAAAQEVFSQYPGIQIAAKRYTQWREDVGRDITSELIGVHGLPDGVWCDSGLQGAGAMQAFLDVGLQGAQVPPHAGGDLNHVFQLAVRHEIPLVAVEYPAWMGARAFQAGLDVLEGRVLPRHIEVNSQVVVSRDHETLSIHADVFADDYVRWDMPGDYIASHGLGETYAPDQFNAIYPGKVGACP